MLNKQEVIVALAICNSIYLSYISFEAFMLNDNIEQFTKNFILSLSTLFFIILGYVLIFTFKPFLYFFFSFKVRMNLKSIVHKILAAFFFIGYIGIVYGLGEITVQNTYDNNLILYFSLVFEIMSLFFLKRVDEGIYKFISIILLWLMTGMCTYLVYGFFVKYLEYKFLENFDLQLVFTSVFFHLLNASFLFYTFFQKNNKLQV